MTIILERVKTALADRYVIERELGAGGMAIVYLATDPKLGRKVAIKVLRPELASAMGVDRFVREVKLTSQLEHPNILSIFDAGEADGFLYYVMPLVEGESGPPEGDGPATFTVTTWRINEPGGNATSYRATTPPWRSSTPPGTVI